MKRAVCIILILCALMAQPVYAGERSLGTYRITFYCNCPKCCGSWSGGKTASGTWPTRYRTVAAGNDLPFGTMIRIEGFEDIRVVEDRGVGSGCIDVFVPDHQECLRLGLMYREVFIEEAD